MTSKTIKLSQYLLLSASDLQNCICQVLFLYVFNVVSSLQRSFHRDQKLFVSVFILCQFSVFIFLSKSYAKLEFYLRMYWKFWYIKVNRMCFAESQSINLGWSLIQCLHLWQIGYPHHICPCVHWITVRLIFFNSILTSYIRISNSSKTNKQFFLLTSFIIFVHLIFLALIDLKPLICSWYFYKPIWYLNTLSLVASIFMTIR